MSEEVLIALNDLTNGALNYYQAIETVMVRKQVIENYIKQLQKEKEILKSNNKTLNIQKEQAYKIADDYYKENQSLKKQLDTSNELVAQSVQTEMKLRDENNRLRKEYQETYKDVRIEIKEYKSQQKKFIEYLENEKDRLSRECSQTYEDSLGKTRLVNEDIFNEVDKISIKYEEIIGGKDE